MRCDFCGEEVEGHPFFKDGMCFCSVECSDAMEGGESLPLDEDVLDDAEDADDQDYSDSSDDDDSYDSDELEEDSYGDDKGY